MRLAAVADLHCTRDHAGFWASRLAAVNDEADALLLAGDLTLSGDLAELDVLLGELKAVSVPMVAVLGNHDYDSGRARIIAERLRRAGITTLEGSATSIRDVVVVGAMGVEGGFARQSRRRWSYAERQLMERLKYYLAPTEAAHRVVLLHYAPIVATLGNEPEDLYELLGSSAMEVAIDAVGADLIVHGHAHYGAPEGQTVGGIPVYNTALPVLEAQGCTRPYRIFELPS